MDALKFARAYTAPDGVQIWMLPYETPLKERVSQAMTRAFGVNTEDGRRLLPPDEAVFAVCAPLTVKVVLPIDPPVWGIILEDLIRNRVYLSDPVGAWREFYAVFPSAYLLAWFAAYEATRPRELMAAPEIQGGAPDDGEEGDAGAENPPTGSGGAS